MTGFGCGVARPPGADFVIEVRITAVNRKSLDIQIAAPREWAGLDQACLEWLKGAFERGRVNVQIAVTDRNREALGISVDESVLDSALERLRGYATSRDIPFEPNAALLLDLARTLCENTGLPEWTTVETTVREAFDAALSEVARMRAAEGAALAEDIHARVEELDAIRGRIATAATGAAAAQREALLGRLRQLELDLDPGDERVLKELALFADRCDISEELTRLESHFGQFREFLDVSEPCGRKMDFLCQEILRELNTIGSKASRVAITRGVIDGKNAVERVREQVQNVE